MVRFERRRPPRDRAEDFLGSRVLLDRLHVVGEAKRRRAEERCAAFAGETRELDRIADAGREWFVDEQRLARREDRPRLREMYPPVYAGDHDRVDAPQERFDGIDHLDVPLVAKFRGELLDPRRAGLDVRAAAFERGDDPRAWNVIRPGGIVQQLCERTGV